MDALARGSTVLSSGQHVSEPVARVEFARTVGALAGHAVVSEPAFLETGIKVIDVTCPLVAGGTLAIAGDLGAGITVLMEEIVRRLSRRLKIGCWIIGEVVPGERVVSWQD